MGEERGRLRLRESEMQIDSLLEGKERERDSNI